MNNITEITRRDIFDLFNNGYVEYDIIGNKQNIIIYHYYGRLTEIEFLKKIHPLNKNSRFENAGCEILQDAINRDSGWIFKDERFELLNGNDSILLDFLCVVFHPENRYEEGYCKEYLERINNFIRKDGYELYESGKISGRSIFSWRKITPEEVASGRFLPFSIRNKKAIDEKNIKLPSISKKVRAEFLNLFNQYNKTQYRTDETNWNYSITDTEAVIEDISGYYAPKAFNIVGKYSETGDFEQFIMNNYPYCVFDAIELFAQNNYNNFANEVNLIFQNNGFVHRLLGGKIEITQTKIQTNEVINEIGLKELIEQATLLYNNGNVSDKQYAVEKLWDAFERLKTYYSTLSKKESTEKLISEMSNGNDSYKSLFDEEFKKLTTIGNQFRIRHHETDKIDITDNSYYDYFYQRCFALVNLSLKYLK
ncbi:MAG: hypothetical protein LBM67_08760 [Lentimicrobiaceae bacterium]|jgi:hypothetical protein|nr:hypothetical protein [Lentimicrobiaceae bacterium]